MYGYVTVECRRAVGLFWPGYRNNADDLGIAFS